MFFVVIVLILFVCCLLVFWATPGDAQIFPVYALRYRSWFREPYGTLEIEP